MPRKKNSAKAEKGVNLARMRKTDRILLAENPDWSFGLCKGCHEPAALETKGDFRGLCLVCGAKKLFKRCLDGSYTTADAAKKVGVSRQTLHSWINAGLVPVPKPVKVGRREFRLWTGHDIEKLKKFRGTFKRCPKEKS